MTIREMLVSIRQRLGRSIVESAEDAEPRLFLFGLVAVFGYPSYYLVWAHLYPQPYESIGMRLACAAVATPALLIRFWPRTLRKYVPAYWYTAIVVCGPFFFFFMLFRNDINTVWSGSVVVGILLVLLLFDLLNSAIIIAAGGLAAYALFALTSTEPLQWQAFAEQLPVYAFTAVTVSIFNREIARANRARIAAAMALGGHIAHELRTPLATMRSAAQVLSRYIPSTLDANCPAQYLRESDTVRPQDRELLCEAPRVIALEADRSFLVIDLLLANAGVRPSGARNMEDIDMASALDSALQRYPFASRAERAWVQLDATHSFRARMDQVLFEHIVFNLLKNSIYAIRGANRQNRGQIRIWTECAPPVNRLHFRDNGQGIPTAIVSRIFSPFYSTRANGTGLGLHFCQTVMDRIGGNILCRSRPGEYTELVLEFPCIPRPRPAEPTPMSGARSSGNASDTH